MRLAGLGFWIFYGLVALALYKWGVEAVNLVASRNAKNLAAVGEVMK